MEPAHAPGHEQVVLLPLGGEAGQADLGEQSWVEMEGEAHGESRQ